MKPAINKADQISFGTHLVSPWEMGFGYFEDHVMPCRLTLLLLLLILLLCFKHVDHLLIPGPRGSEEDRQLRFRGPQRCQRWNDWCRCEQK